MNFKRNRTTIGFLGLGVCTLLLGINSYQVAEQYEAQIATNEVMLGELVRYEKEDKKQQQDIKALEEEVVASKEKVAQADKDKEALTKEAANLTSEVTKLEQDLKIKREKVALEKEQKEKEELVMVENEATESEQVATQVSHKAEEPTTNTQETLQPSPEQSQEQTTSTTSAGTFAVTFYSAYDGTQSGVTAGGTDMAGGNITTSDGYNIIAVDPNVIPMGTKLKVTLPNGTVINGKADDSGGLIKGNKIDIATHSAKDAFSKGRTEAKVEIVN